MDVKNKQLYFLKIPLLLLGIVILSFFGLNAASAADPSHIYVNTTGNDNYNGQSAVYDGTNGPKATIKNGTGTVKTNGTIYIANGVYKEYRINIYTNMTIIGENQKKTIIDAQGFDNIFNIAKGVTLTLINLTLTNGTATNGGAIHNTGTLTVTNCTIQKNTANNQGGAIYNRGGTITINSTIQNNTADNQGGTIYNSGTVTITSCTLQNNKAHGQGGAIFNYATVIINNSTVKNNTAHDGGAIYNNGLIEITSSTLKNNSADGFGGAIFNTGQDASYLHFNWIVGNTAILGSAIHKIEAGTLDATNNWWGSNLASDIAANIYGYVTYDPWVILTVNVSPAKINNGQTSTVTADFNHINGGGQLVGGHIPEGPITLTIPWGSFNNLVITHSITENTVSGMISTTFYANEGAVTPLYNPVKVTAKADDYSTTDTESAYIQINKTANINY